MGFPVPFDGCNRRLTAPHGYDGLLVQAMYTFTNGHQSVSCWELTDEELAEVIRTKRLFVSVWSGRSQPPIYVGIERDTRDLLADYGVWSC